VAIHLARQLTGKSLEQIGRYFGGRDHTTILHSLETTEARLRTDPAIRRAAAEIRRLIAQA
jgi:chromosomal replication initiator protein